MLKSLLIKDYALIDAITVLFEPGLNIITGETGAGKSILLGAMGLLLGDRASSESIRSGASKAVVEGIFDSSQNKKLRQLCEKNDIDLDDELIVRREISAKGSGRCFLNDTPVPLNLLKETGDLLVDLHGQHEHQSLLRSELHIDILDEFCGTEALLNDYAESYKKVQELRRKIRDLLDNEREIKRNREIYEYQLKEIDAVAPLENEDKELHDEIHVQEHGERLMDLAESAYGALYENNASALDVLSKIKEDIRSLAEIDHSFTPVTEEIESAVTLVKDIAYQLRDYKNKIEIDPERLNQMRSRLSALQALKKRFNTSLDGVLALREKLALELSLSENFEDRIKELQQICETERKAAGAKALVLSRKRKTEAKKVEKDIVEILAELGIANASFEVRFESSSPEDKTEGLIAGEEVLNADAKGIDSVTFLMSANAGEPVKPLAKVASGGEVSRVMLALKSILAKNDRLPLLVFDEIDTGVSGRIAQKVGATLLNLASFHQIIAITHLPQIAGMSDVHFVVEKHEENGRSRSHIRKLTEEEHGREVAKLLSGEEVTQNSLNSAKELIASKRTITTINGNKRP
jgi:DNA repair protein RecN (Recombination protein N)